MKTMIPFSFEGQEVRAITIDGEPWFVGKDVAEALGYANPSKAMSDHCKGVTKRYPLSTPGGTQEVRILSEPDVLRLAVHSTLPAAQRFERLVFEVILPTIRRTGRYGPERNADTVPASTRLYLLKYREQLARKIGATGRASAHQVLYRNFVDVSTQLGMPALPLDRLVPTNPYAAILEDFWALFPKLDHVGLNHSNDPTVVAYRLVQVLAAAEDKGLTFPYPPGALRKALRTDPRFLHHGAVSSRIHKRSVKCWVFSASGGEASQGPRQPTLALIQ